MLLRSCLPLFLIALAILAESSFAENRFVDIDYKPQIVRKVLRFRDFTSISESASTTQTPETFTTEEHTTTQTPETTTTEEHTSTQTPETTTEMTTTETTSTTQTTEMTTVETTTATSTTNEATTTNSITLPPIVPNELPQNKSLFFIEDIKTGDVCLLLTADISFHMNFLKDEEDKHEATETLELTTANVSGSCQPEQYYTDVAKFEVMNLRWSPKNNASISEFQLLLVFEKSHADNQTTLHTAKATLSFAKHNSTVAKQSESEWMHKFDDFKAGANETFACNAEQKFKMKQASKEMNNIVKMELIVKNLKFNAFRNAKNSRDFNPKMKVCSLDASSVNTAAIVVPIMLILVIIAAALGYIYYRKRRESRAYSQFD